MKRFLLILVIAFLSSTSMAGEHSYGYRQMVSLGQMKTSIPSLVSPSSGAPPETESYWATGITTGLVFKYDSALGYTGTSVDLKAEYNSCDSTVTCTVVGDCDPPCTSCGGGVCRPGTIFWGSSQPRDIARDDAGNFYVIDMGYGQRVYKFTDEWEFTGFVLDVNPQETSPQAIEVVKVGGYIYIGGANKKIYQYDPSGTYIQFYDLSSEFTGVSDNIQSIRVGSNGNWWAVSKTQALVFEYDSAWIFTGNSYSTFHNLPPVIGTGLYGFDEKEDLDWVTADTGSMRFEVYDPAWTFQSTVTQAEDTYMSGISKNEGEKPMLSPPPPAPGICYPDPCAVLGDCQPMCNSCNLGTCSTSPPVCSPDPCGTLLDCSPVCVSCDMGSCSPFPPTCMMDPCTNFLDCDPVSCTTCDNPGGFPMGGMCLP